MKLRVVVSLLAVLSFFGGAVYAQEKPTFDVFAGYSYLRERPSSGSTNDFSLNGGSASFAYNFNRWLSGVADVGAYHNGNILGTKTDGTLTTYLFGPRISYRHFGRVTPFGEVLFGGAHAGANFLGTTSSQDAFAMAVGAGVDYRLSKRLSIRPLKVDYLLTRFSEPGRATQNQNNIRASAGVVFHF
jgi:outer membrane immunogenic protein